jgi:hypothetical protein
MVLNGFHLKFKEEFGSDSLFALNVYASFKQLANLSADIESESNPLVIDSILLLELAIELEQLRLVLW